MPPVEVELTSEMLKRGGLSGGNVSKPLNRPKKPSASDLADSDSMHSVASIDPLEIKPQGINNQSG